MPFQIYSEPARSILTKTSGYLAEAGFTHSLSPARNCTYGCSYCYVPTMGIYGGLRGDDVKRWGQYTTFKSNAAELLARALKPDQVIYCSPLVDVFQPAEEEVDAMMPILEAVASRPPRVFVIQTRSPRVVQYVDLIRRIPNARVSFTITTDKDEVRRVYEPNCDPIERRFDAVRQLCDLGINAFVTLAPMLPCDPEQLVDRLLETSPNPILCDPFHTRIDKPRGATTRDAAQRISERLGYSEWHDPAFQKSITNRMAARANAAGRRFALGAEAFGLLTS
jgi:DNA repair photolyase